MTKTKTFLLSLVMAILAAGLSSCDDVEYDPADAPFLGSWIQDSGATGFTFFSNGSGYYTNYYDGDVVEFTWDYDDWYLNIYFIEDEWNYQWDFTPDMELELYDTYTSQTIYFYPI